MQWTYIDDFGRRHNVGLYHGMRSGHLLVYCNKRILLIDFNVRNSKTYTFYINDELCDLSIERKNNKFAYGFEIDKKTETPKNLLRRKIERSDTRKILLAILGMTLLISSIAFLMMKGIL